MAGWFYTAVGQVAQQAAHGSCCTLIQFGPAAQTRLDLRSTACQIPALPYARCSVKPGGRNVSLAVCINSRPLRSHKNDYVKCPAGKLHNRVLCDIALYYARVFVVDGRFAPILRFAPTRMFIANY